MPVVIASRIGMYRFFLSAFLRSFLCLNLVEGAHLSLGGAWWFYSVGRISNDQSPTGRLCESNPEDTMVMQHCMRRESTFAVLTPAL